jgi:hypothetical protein
MHTCQGAPSWVWEESNATPTRHHLPSLPPPPRAWQPPSLRSTASVCCTWMVSSEVHMCRKSSTKSSSTPPQTQDYPPAQRDEKAVWGLVTINWHLISCGHTKQRQTCGLSMGLSACLYVCMNVYKTVWVSLSLSVWLHVCMHVYIYMYVCVCMYCVYVCMPVWQYVCMYYECMYVCMYVFISLLFI